MAKNAMLKIQLLVFIILLFPIMGYGEIIEEGHAISPADAHGKIINNITLKGLNRTKSHVVFRELVIHKDQLFSNKRFNESIQRLKNIRLFSKVDTRLVKVEQDQVHVYIDLEERWTFIPILKATQGGETEFFVLGAYDINVGGGFLESGAQLENWNGHAGGVVWFRDPRFLNRRLLLGGDVWSVKRPRELFLQDGTTQGSFVLDRQRVNVFLEYEYLSSLSAGIGIDFHRDELRAPKITPQLDTNAFAQLNANTKLTTTFLRPYLKLGRLDYNTYLIEGVESKLTIEKSLTTSDSNIDVYRVIRCRYINITGGRFHKGAADVNISISVIIKIAFQRNLAGFKISYECNATG